MSDLEVNNNPQTVKVSTASILSMLGYQVVFYAVTFVVLFWIVTFNWKGILLTVILVILQLPIKRKNQTYIKFVLDYLKPQQFFAILRHYEQPVPDQEKTMFAFHPHSVFSYGVLGNINNKNYPNEKLTEAPVLGSRFMLSMPIIGIHFKFWGIQSVDPTNLKRLMKHGTSISLLPGGYQEATLTTPKQFRIFIKNRKGFIKYALKYGYTIRPVLITNEHKAMSTFDGLLRSRLMLNKLKIPAVYYWCRYGLLFPPGIRMHTIIGQGIKSEKIYQSNQQPNSEQINEFHAKYIEEVKRIYDKHKQKNGNTPLAIY